MQITEIKELAGQPRPGVDEEDAPLESIAALEELYASIDLSTDEAAGGRKEYSAGEKILKGGRNNSLTSLAGTMRRRGMCGDSIFAALMGENEAKCDPPLPKYEVRKIAQGIERYAPTDPFYDVSATPRFPSEILPPTLRRFVEEASSSTVCPQEYIAVPMLTILGAAIGNSLVLRVKSDWIEGPTVYSAIVGPPGDRKTPALTKASSPAKRRQGEYQREYEQAMARYRSLKREWEAARRQASNEGITAPEPPVKPTMRRTVVDDITAEALAARLEENPRGVACVKDELSSLINGMNQYKSGKGNDQQFYLSTWSNAPHTVDRKGDQEPLMIPRPFVGIVGGIQPDILPDLKKKDRDDGFVDRFVFAWPESIPGHWNDNELSDEAQAAYQEVYDRLCDLPMDADENGRPVPRQVKFSPAAKQVFIEEHDALENEMNSSGLPKHLRGPWSKMKSYLGRYSLILAAVRWAEGENYGVAEGENYGVGSCQWIGEYPHVTERDVKAAAELIKYFKGHDHKVHAKLQGEKPQNLLGEALKSFLREQGGSWEGMTQEFFDIFRTRSTPGLPGGSGPFGKMIREIARRDDDLRLAKGHKGKNPIIKLSLSTPDTVAHEGVTDTDTEGTDSTEGKNEAEHAGTGSEDAEEYMAGPNSVDDSR